MQRLRSTVPKLALVVLVPFLLGAEQCELSPVLDMLNELVRMVEDLGVRVNALEACDCEGVLAPVCGEDGVTYVNRCEAGCAGVSVEYPGKCRPVVCYRDAECTRNEFCEFAICPEIVNDMAPIQRGECVPIPDGCPEILEPVCGCDGVTYENDCFRREARVSKAHDGRCDEPPPLCGGIAGLECPSDDQVCIFRPGTCNWADHFGECVERPEACIDLWDPVCGCDAKTYSNSCYAVMAGVSIDYEGECTPQCGVPLPEAWFGCESHRDCVVVDGVDCCTCTMGGEQAALNGNCVGEVENFREHCCSQVSCPAVYMCLSGLRAVCEAGICQLSGQEP